MKANPTTRLYVPIIFGAYIVTAVLPATYGRTKTLSQQVVPVPHNDAQGVALDNAPLPAKWKVILTATGGELSATVDITEIAVMDAKRQGLCSRAPAGGKPEVKRVSLSEPAVKRLWKVVAEVDAMNLADFSRTNKDSPDYTIRLEVAGKTHTMRVRGASGSEKHLKLILAIEKCFSEGVSP